jgi:hypothetical protein
MSSAEVAAKPDWVPGLAEALDRAPDQLTFVEPVIGRS